MAKPEKIIHSGNKAAVKETVAGYDIPGIVYERLAVEIMNFSECSLSNAQERQVRIRVYNRLLREYRRRLDKSDFDKFRFAVENYLFTEQERYVK